MNNEQNDPLKNASKIPMIAVLLTGAFIAILNQTLLTTALPSLMADLEIDANLGQWVTTAFMLVNGVMIPITAFLIEKFTSRKLFITAMVLFGIGTLVCAIAPTFGVLITGRMIQAAGAGIAMPLMQTILLLIFPVEKRGAAMGMVGLVISFAPAIGPTLSGWLVQSYHWSILFWILLPIVILDIIAAFFVLKNVTTLRSPKLDTLSIILSSLGFGGLLFGFSNAGANGWLELTVLLPTIIGVVTLTWFILRQLKLPQPILEFRVFKYWVFTLTTIIGMIVFMSMIGAATIFPIYMQTMHNFTALESGLMLLPGAVVMGIMSPITGRIFDKIGARYLGIVGLGMIFLTTALFTNLSDSTSMTYVTVIYSFRMLGVALVMMPITTAGINVLPRHLIPHGTAMNNTMRQIAGSIGTAVLVSVMTSVALNQGEAGNIGMVDAQIKGVNTAFMVATGISFVGFVLAFFIKSKPKETVNAETYGVNSTQQKTATDHS
ncbi:MDR family MFS transporter [Alkalicoccobacillus murimartini]|uniref:EmrB/QacA subfamily drug resistance transporter n=1 Tax=Alkalicoccobacillus murimartini TaxID=171685 RepID=A0ABT9YD69_9BACI|nr:MDR family MFS transporter [Alkalicoccobacillus murimartini]MDQ0205790.1 EmrB/QacA subfamily drug resistance transporter [Alkalicoccobacillus murimartini]